MLGDVVLKLRRWWRRVRRTEHSSPVHHPQSGNEDPRVDEQRASEF